MKGKGKARATPKGCGGHQQGATNFTEVATMELLNVVENILPIGGDSWTAVQNEYNKFAKLNGQPEWDGCLLKQKYEKVGPLCWCVGIPPSPHIQLVHAAKEKPTGEANHSELLEMAL